MSMKVGEKAELTIKPEYAYGIAGAPPKIATNATLVFEIELLQCADRKPTRWQLNDMELCKVAEKYKADGNAKF